MENTDKFIQFIDERIKMASTPISEAAYQIVRHRFITWFVGTKGLSSDEFLNLHYTTLKAKETLAAVDEIVQGYTHPEPFACCDQMKLVHKDQLISTETNSVVEGEEERYAVIYNVHSSIRIKFCPFCATEIFPDKKPDNKV